MSVTAKAKTILSAHLSLIQDDEFAGNIRRLMTEQHQGLGGGDHQQYGAGLRQAFCFCQRLSARTC